jgi:polyisoprenoid-binding protein YceI
MEDPMSTTAPVFAATETSRWNVDHQHTTAEFAVKHMMIATVRGRFADITGSVTMPDEDLTRGAISIEIGTASVDTRESQRDQHLRSGEFFDAENYPKINFRSRRIEKSGEGAYRVTGDLTIRDVTREVTLRVQEEGRTRDPWGKDRVGFVAEGKVDRTDFGLTWNVALETGGVLVSHDVRLRVEGQLIKQD